jgi:hypothetical protein
MWFMVHTRMSSFERGGEERFVASTNAFERRRSFLGALYLSSAHFVAIVVFFVSKRAS